MPRRPRSRRASADAAIPRRRIRSIRDLDWFQFQRLVAEIYRRKQCQVRILGHDDADTGCDLRCSREGSVFLVQCHHRPIGARLVPVKALRELAEVRSSAFATGLVVYTSGRFSREAREFARRNQIVLMDGKAMRTQMRQIQAQSGSKLLDPGIFRETSSEHEVILRPDPVHAFST